MDFDKEVVEDLESIRDIVMVVTAVMRMRKELKKRRIRRGEKIMKKNFKNEKLDSFKKHCLWFYNIPEAVKAELFVPPSLLRKLVDLLKSNDPSHNWKLDPFEQTVVFLQYVTSGQSLGCIARRCGIATSTVSTIVKRVSATINSNLDTIRVPSSPEDWRSIEDSFVRNGLIRCMGALDGKHIRTKAPPNSGTLFFNYKKFFSFSLLALVDANLKFRFLDIGSPGSVSDASIYENCKLKEILQNKENLPKPIFLTNEIIMPSFVVGDGIFPLDSTLLKPYGRAPLSDDQILFNRIFSKTRVKVEHAFGVLSGRFRILQTQIELNYESAVELVTSLIRLHNDLIPEDDHPPTIVFETPSHPYRDAKEQRDALMKFLLQ